MCLMSIQMDFVFKYCFIFIAKLICSKHVLIICLEYFAYYKFVKIIIYMFNTFIYIFFYINYFPFNKLFFIFKLTILGKIVKFLVYTYINV